jgi:2-iminobutanoate/2-iminopropanoate deaminase
MIDIHRTDLIDGAPAPGGPSHWTWNSLVFVSGVRGIDPKTGQPADGDGRRIELIFEHLRQMLEQAGSSLDSLLSSTVYVTDMARLRPMVNDACVRAFFGANLPIRTIARVAALNQNDSVKIEIIAVKRNPG